MTNLTFATTCKEALAAWKEKTKEDLATTKRVNLEYQSPPIIRLGSSIKVLAQCEVLNLASNMIERPTMPVLKHLRVLNLSRNNLQTLNGVECLGKTLQELWVSYNLLSYIKPIEALKNLKVLYISHNNIRDWAEFKRLGTLQHLIELSFSGNPLQETMTEERFRREAMKRLPNLCKLDFVPCIRTASALTL